jgi:hypothetical protein
MRRARASWRLAALAALLLGAAAPARGDDVGELGGFGEDEDFEVQVDTDQPLVPKRWWDVDGSIAISTSWNYLAHHSDAPPPQGPSYTGLARLRTRLNLELDLDLPHEFKVRASPYVWYDWTYLIRGIGQYTDKVINEYEWEFDLQDTYIEGPLADDVDIKIGRQVVNWGRSDSVRVLDVLNPLDNREPGRADIEDLRWAVGMAKVDYYHRPWTFTVVAIPEMRFDDLPPVGSDFNPLPVQPVPKKEPDSFENWEFAGRLRGIFEGWDVSLQGAWYFEDIPTLRCRNSPCVAGLRFEYERLWHVGAGANYTLGSWLFKGEVAWIDGFQYTTCEPQPCDPLAGSVFSTDPDTKYRLDGMLGVEYYGITDTTIAVEAVNRYIVGYDELVLSLPVFLRENSTTWAIRYTADWLNQRLRTTLLALLFGYKLQDGAILRFQGEYTLRDGLVLTAGLLLYHKGDLPPLDTWGRNDRFFVDLKWSF